MSAFLPILTAILIFSHPSTASATTLSAQEILELSQELAEDCKNISAELGQIEKLKGVCAPATNCKKEILDSFNVAKEKCGGSEKYLGNLSKRFTSCSAEKPCPLASADSGNIAALASEMKGLTKQFAAKSSSCDALVAMHEKSKLGSCQREEAIILLGGMQKITKYLNQISGSLSAIVE